MNAQLQNRGSEVKIFSVNRQMILPGNAFIAAPEALNNLETYTATASH